jgi:hypothetical protein
MIDFAAMRRALMEINDLIGDGYLIACSWNGKFMHVSIGKAPGDRRPWVMTLDSEEDYALNSDMLLREFVDGAKRWFREELP